MIVVSEKREGVGGKHLPSLERFIELRMEGGEARNGRLVSFDRFFFFFLLILLLLPAVLCTPHKKEKKVISLHPIVVHAI